MLYAIIGAIVVVIAIFITIGMVASNKNPGSDKDTKNEKVQKKPLDLLTTDNLGKAIEIQALLAREGITAYRRMDGTKSVIYLENYKMSERDRALLSIVKSGFMDQNVGLEVFDKGDFTSTKEDKRIRLARAVNGELSRLIRRIPPIENASVFVSIPEPTMFTQDAKPITATIQLTMPSGEVLDQLKVRAIRNLILGSVTGLEPENISITDTNGNVYDSIINADDDILRKLQENDKYMQQKVATQLDRLVGKGNYVATVSTFLRQAPVEKSSIVYDPERKTSVSEQTFTEGLGDQTRDQNRGLNAVSVYLPNGLPGGAADSAQNRSYARSAKETQYGVTKTQVNEYIKPGAIEEISIAVTLDQASVPSNVTLEELKELIATAASPKALPEQVSIAYSDSLDPYLASDRPTTLPKPDETGNPWWLAGLLVVIGLSGGLIFISNKQKQAAIRQQEELEELRERTIEQDRQLRDVNLKAAELIEKQSQLAQNMIENNQAQYQQPQQAIPELGDTISDITSDLENVDEDEAIEQLKSWIEKP